MRGSMGNYGVKVLREEFFAIWGENKKKSSIKKYDVSFYFYKGKWGEEWETRVLRGKIFVVWGEKWKKESPEKMIWIFSLKRGKMWEVWKSWRKGIKREFFTIWGENGKIKQVNEKKWYEFWVLREEIYISEGRNGKLLSEGKKEEIFVLWGETEENCLLNIIMCFLDAYCWQGGKSEGKVRGKRERCSRWGEKWGNKR